MATRWVGAALALALLAAALQAPAAAAEVGPGRAIAAAEADPKVESEREEGGSLSSSAAKVDGRWEVSFFAAGDRVALVIVDPGSGLVLESWTGYQVDWKMARGYPGSFGHRLNAPYVFLPLCALFIIGLFDWRRPLRWANLDLIALLGFGVSHLFFNRGEIGVSVPLQYPVLVYLLARALWIGLGRARGGGIRPVWPTAWLIVAACFLVGLRAGLNIADSGAIDVGYAGVVGADLIGHGEPLYGNFPADVSHGDTYGPFNYLSYVPFEAIWPWGGGWDDLPAAHGAAVAFDLAAIVLLALLGTRLRGGSEGRRLGATLGFAWAAYPYTAFVLESNSNDSLVAVLLVAVLLVSARPMARGAVLALAAAAKFAPILLAPMLAAHRDGSGRGRWRAFGLGFAVVTAALLAWPAIDPGLAVVWERTIGYQSGRDSPFSVWGQVAWLEPLRITIAALALVLSAAFAFRPKGKDVIQVAALGAALIITLQLAAQHWFYLYIVWFFPLLLVALAGEPEARRPASAAAPARSSRPALAR